MPQKEDYIKISEVDKKIVKLKNFESSLLQLRQSIRNIKCDFRKSVYSETCDKLKENYKKKLADYTIKELNHLVEMIDKY